MTDGLGILITQAKIQRKVNLGITDFINLKTSPEHELEIAEVMKKVFKAKHDVYTASLLFNFYMNLDTFQGEMSKRNYPSVIAKIAAQHILKRLFEFDGVKEIYDELIKQIEESI